MVRFPGVAGGLARRIDPSLAARTKIFQNDPLQEKG
jgi:hypothetical protein